ncbi:MAG TPA: SAM-dependent methyltransferase [Polyangium sp.]|nr:SAM-dependent methyltransferase [Polyangium sp.]
MRSNRPSFTSKAVASVRAFYAEIPEPLGLGPDPLAQHLLPPVYLLPARAAERLGAIPQASAALHRAYGAISAGLTFHVALRTHAIDEALGQSVAAGVKQIVLLGAGFDGRAYRLPELAGTRVFEVDHPNTQRDKQERLAQANLQSYADISFVAVDFEKDSLEQSLRAAGFSSREKSFWIWEGVTAYLTHEAIRGTLEAITRSSAPGSRLAMTYVRPPSQGADPSHPIVYRGMRTLVHTGMAVLSVVGEPVRGFLDMEKLERLAREAGFRIESDENARDWAQKYWPGQSHGPFEWERIAVLVLPDDRASIPK